jgi:hypothetical protein
VEWRASRETFYLDITLVDPLPASPNNNVSKLIDYPKNTHLDQKTRKRDRAFPLSIRVGGTINFTINFFNFFASFGEQRKKYC